MLYFATHYLDVDSALGEPTDQSSFEHARMRAPVASDGDPPSAFVAGERRIGAAEGISVGFGQRVADDSPNVIFAQDGGVELVGHGVLRDGPSIRRECGYSVPPQDERDKNQPLMLRSR